MANTRTIQRRTSTPLRLEHGGWSFLIDKNSLQLFVGDQWQATLPLTPRVNGKQCPLGSWRKMDREHFCAAVRGLGQAHVAVREGRVAYWLEIRTRQLKTLAYFPGMIYDGERWQSYMSDGWDRLWERDRDQDVGVSSAYLDMTNVFGAEIGGMKDPRDTPPTYIWNIPPRAFSLQTSAGFIGFTVPGPQPIGLTRLSMKNRKFTLSFEPVRPACSGGVTPIVYIVPGLDGAYDVLDEHRVISTKLGLMVKKPAKHPAWWTKPTYKASLQYIRIWQDMERDDPPPGDDHRTGVSASQAQRDRRMAVINPENLRNWTYQVKQSLDIDEMNVMFEQGMFCIYGDYTPIPTLGGTKGFRALVDEFRTKKIHVCFYIHPFMVNTKIKYFQKYPEALCKPIDRKTELYYNSEHLYDANPTFGLIDWTHPKGRAYLLRQVEYILSSKRGCLDCDWIRSNHWRGPDPRYYKFHDPDWGIGDMMSFKAQKLLYEHAKKVKPHCCVSKVAFAEPYIQPYADVNMLCEDHTPWTDSWYARGEIATRTLREMIYLTDPWQNSVTKAQEYYTAMAAWCTNEVPDVAHIVHPYGIYFPMKRRDYNRRRAGVHTQANAPLNTTDEIRVRKPSSRDETPEIWRKRTSGRLNGWFAALVLGRRTFVTYSETEARIATTETRFVRVPLPPKAKVSVVEMVPHQGKKVKWPAETIMMENGDCVKMKVEDCGGRALYYRIKYHLS